MGVGGKFAPRSEALTEAGEAPREHEGSMVIMGLITSAVKAATRPCPCRSRTGVLVERQDHRRVRSAHETDELGLRAGAQRVGLSVERVEDARLAVAVERDAVAPVRAVAGDGDVRGEVVVQGEDGPVLERPAPRRGHAHDTGVDGRCFDRRAVPRETVVVAVS